MQEESVRNNPAFRWRRQGDVCEHIRRHGRATYQLQVMTKRLDVSEVEGLRLRCQGITRFDVFPARAGELTESCIKIEKLR